MKFLYLIFLNIVVLACSKKDALYNNAIFYKHNTSVLSDHSILRNEAFTSIKVSDSSFKGYKNLKSIGYITIANQKHNDRLEKLLLQTGQDYFPSYECSQLFRNIILFYKNEQLIYIAKFSFDCNLCCIINVKNNSVAYIYNQDLENLWYDLLKQKVKY